MSRTESVRAIINLNQQLTDYWTENRLPRTNMRKLQILN